MKLITEVEVDVCDAASQRLDRQYQAGNVLTVADVQAEMVRAIAYLDVHVSTEERQRAQRFLEMRYVIGEGPGGGGNELTDSRSKIPEWVPHSKPSAAWPFWYRYQKLMRSRLAPGTLQDLDDYTDRILTKLGNPRLEPKGHPRRWDVRGMVAGHVQSGKTSNYIGLITKAADAGYKLIVVLTGIHENLRIQTQERIDEGFIGKKAAGNPKDPHEPTGVGRIEVPGVTHAPVAFWGTTQAPGGDFRTANLKGFGVEIRPDLPPVVLVVKKNGSVLRQLLKWVVGEQQENLPGKSGHYEDRLHDVPHFYRHGCPLLIVDDEADQASVDTGAGGIDDMGVPNTDYDPTSINRLIRSILRSFDQSAYVGYTATPFANILIHDGKATKTHGDDLFPRDFIINLPTPPTYVGPTAIFGRRFDDDDDRSAVDGLESELVEIVTDHAADPDDIRETKGWMPPVQTQSHVVDPNLPESLRNAIADWTLAGAALVCRGRGHEHHSMLIHVTRFQEVMNRLQECAAHYWDDWSTGVSNGEPEVMNLLRSRWERKFPAANGAVRRARPQELALLSSLTWRDLSRAVPGQELTPLQQSVGGVKVLQVHGGLKGKPLDYRKEHQLKVIAIGGNKLSRGLTLENLTVSYFLRTTRMYDTLMQMGRWFGYRPGVLDVCRLYMPRDLRDWFEHMADATEELREEFDRMAAQGAKPSEFGLRVRSHPVMTVTSSVKMRDGMKILVTFSDTRPESVVFDVTPGALKANWQALESFVRALGQCKDVDPRLARPAGEKEYKGFLWREVNAKTVTRFLGALTTPNFVTVAHAPRVAQYIDRMSHHGELVTWTVFIRHNKDSQLPLDQLPHGIEVGRSLRKRSPEEKSAEKRGKFTGVTFSTKVLIDSDYETLDIGREDYGRALEAKRKGREDAGQKAREEARRKGREEPKEEGGKGEVSQPGGWVRLFRPPTNGLLLVYPVQPYDVKSQTEAESVISVAHPLVGFAVSFPRSENEERVEYVVGNVYLNEDVQKMRASEEADESD